MLRKLDLPSKHKGVVTAFSQRWTVGCIEVTSSLEMKISPTSADNVMPTLKTDFVPTLWRHSDNVIKSQLYKVAYIFST